MRIPSPVVELDRHLCTCLGVSSLGSVRVRLLTQGNIASVARGLVGLSALIANRGGQSGGSAGRTSIDTAGVPPARVCRERSRVICGPRKHIRSLCLWYIPPWYLPLSHGISLLRCGLASTLRPSLSTPPAPLPRPTRNRFAEEVCKADAPFAAELFFSLLSVTATYDPVGWGVPYAASITSDLPVREVNMAAQVCMVPVHVRAVAS